MPSFPLPLDLRRRFETLFAAELSPVRIELTECLPFDGVGALASGTVIQMRSEAWSPGTEAGDAVLAHELAHLLQQAERPAQAAATRLLVDPALEEEAHAWARLAVHGGAGRPRRYAAPLRPRSDVAQPWIMMAAGTGDNPFKYGTESYKPPLRYGDTYFNKPDVLRGKPKEENFTQLTDFLATAKKVELAYRFLFSADPPAEMFFLLYRWMGISNGKVLSKDLKDEFEVRRKLFVRGEMRYYHTYGELAWALAQEVETTEETRWERLVARMVLGDELIDHLLQSVAKLVARFIMKNQEAAEAYFDHKPTYGPLHKRASYREVVLSLVTPQHGVADTIALLHDAKDLCGLAKLIDLTEEPCLLFTGSKTLQISKYGTRYNVGTVDEADDWVLWMRSLKRAVWAGPSYTMISMWKMAAAAGASTREMGAMGWAMYAYWNAVYPHTSTPIHRFHETMAGAHQFGITYLPQKTVSDNYGTFLRGNSKL